MAVAPIVAVTLAQVDGLLLHWVDPSKKSKILKVVVIDPPPLLVEDRKFIEVSGNAIWLVAAAFGKWPKDEKHPLVGCQPATLVSKAIEARRIQLAGSHSRGGGVGEERATEWRRSKTKKDGGGWRGKNAQQHQILDICVSKQDGSTHTMKALNDMKKALIEMTPENINWAQEHVFCNHDNKEDLDTRPVQRRPSRSADKEGPEGLTYCSTRKRWRTRVMVAGKVKKVETTFSVKRFMDEAAKMCPEGAPPLTVREQAKELVREAAEEFMKANEKSGDNGVLCPPGSSSEVTSTASESTPPKKRKAGGAPDSGEKAIIVAADSAQREHMGKPPKLPRPPNTAVHHGGEPFEQMLAMY